MLSAVPPVVEGTLIHYTNEIFPRPLPPPSIIQFTSINPVRLFDGTHTDISFLADIEIDGETCLATLASIHTSISIHLSLLFFLSYSQSDTHTQHFVKIDAWKTTCNSSHKYCGIKYIFSLPRSPLVIFHRVYLLSCHEFLPLPPVIQSPCHFSCVICVLRTVDHHSFFFFFYVVDDGWFSQFLLPHVSLCFPSLPLTPAVVFFCRMLSSFLVGLFNLYEDLYFTYLEINPLGKSQKQPIPPRLASVMDDVICAPTQTSDSVLPDILALLIRSMETKYKPRPVLCKAVKFLLAHYF